MRKIRVLVLKDGGHEYAYKCVMSADEDRSMLRSRLSPGSELSCTTVYGDKLRGNVVAVDESRRVVIIKEGDSILSPETAHDGNVHIINLRHVSNLEVLSKPSSPPASPSSLPEIDLSKVERRFVQATQARWKAIISRGVNVSEEAQQLFDAIGKIYSETRWDGSDIVVLGDVRISPPYNPENCTGASLAAERIQKLVAKFHDDKKHSVVDN